MHFIYPSHPLKPASVEPMYTEELSAIQAAGFSASLIPDAVIRGSKPLRNVPSGATVVYRGWMLNAAEYQRLAGAVTDVSAKLMTSTSEYLQTHHCPNWYPLIADLTPETRVLSVTDNLEAEIRAIDWGAYFVKDYVKSLKTSRGSIIRDSSEIGPLINEMKHFRGEIEGGICVRRVEAFVADSELRYFVLDGKPFCSGDEAIPPMVHSAAKRIPSPFFSVDVIRREDGVLRIVEVGDGQVSDLVGWSTSAFAAIWSGKLM